MDKSEKPSQDINTVAEQLLNSGTAKADSDAKGDRRRQSLIQAAYHLIAEGGFERLRTRDVAARAGVNIATLHYYFARKEDLIQGVIEYLLQFFMSAYLSDSSLAERTPLEQIRGELAELQYLLQEKPETFIVMNELTLRSLRDSATQRMLQWLDEGWHSYLEQVIRTGKEQGQFRADIEPDKAATRLIIVTKGITLHYLINPETIDFEAIKTSIEQWLTGTG